MKRQLRKAPLFFLCAGHSPLADLLGGYEDRRRFADHLLRDKDNLHNVRDNCRSFRENGLGRSYRFEKLPLHCPPTAADKRRHPLKIIFKIKNRVSRRKSAIVGGPIFLNSPLPRSYFPLGLQNQPTKELIVNCLPKATLMRAAHPNSRTRSWRVFSYQGVWKEE
jgi:hypothetical protein